jgi:hypothetical protein
MKGLQDVCEGGAELKEDAEFDFKLEFSAWGLTGAPLSRDHARRRQSAPAAKRKRSAGSSVMPWNEERLV